MDPLCAFEERLGYRFLDRSLLLDALVHGSYLNEHARPTRNLDGRFAFLGDAVLSLAVASDLMQLGGGKGASTEARAKEVRNARLARLAERIDVPMQLGEGEKKSEGKAKRLASALEAVLGAIYLDAGPAHAIRIASHLLRRFPPEPDTAP